ncbi:condensation domain-containing protein [Nocardia sp. NPDC127579]|uniref:condensation domain-containing protein n=1 Tax=Nocardia sp. NPDC127579 TaxID=3345402 RepID=UPI00362A67DF
MVNFGFFDEWHPEPGKLTSWRPTPHARAAAAAATVHPAPPSYQQEEYLLAAHRSAGTGFRASRLCMITFDLPGAPDYAALGRTVTAFLRRHDTFHSRFALHADGRIRRHVLVPGLIDVTAVDHGRFQHGAEIRAHVQSGTPGPFEWDCFDFGVIEYSGAFTVYAAVDHLHTDGVAQAVSFADLLTIYLAEVGGTDADLAPVAGHIAYCDRERRSGAQLSLRAPEVRTWVDLLRRNGGDVPSFPLDLGVGPGYTRGAQVTVPLLTEAGAQRFEQVCMDNGGRFLAGIFTALAFTEYELADREWYFGLTPANTRSLPGEAASVGWYTNLIPVSVQLGAEDTFATAVAAAQRSADHARALTAVSPHRVLELVAADPAIRTRRGWSAPMLSYMDVRQSTDVAIFEQINGGLYANSLSPSQVYIWINRFADVTTMTLLFPDTAVAHRSIERYRDRFTTIIASVAAEGDYAVPLRAAS